MATSEEYQRWAAECVEEALQAKSPDKERLLLLAQQWLLLADQGGEVAEFQHDAPLKPDTH